MEQTISSLPEIHSQGMWEYYQGWERLFIGKTDQGWTIQFKIIKADRWKGGIKFLGQRIQGEKYTSVDYVVLTSPDDVWYRTGEASSWSGRIRYEATDQEILEVINTWLKTCEVDRVRVKQSIREARQPVGLHHA